MHVCIFPPISKVIIVRAIINSNIKDKKEEDDYTSEEEDYSDVEDEGKEGYKKGISQLTSNFRNQLTDYNYRWLSSSKNRRIVQSTL